MSVVSNLGLGLVIIIFINWIFGIVVLSMIKSVIIFGLDFTGFLRSALFTILNLFWLMVLHSIKDEDD